MVAVKDAKLDLLRKVPLFSGCSSSSIAEIGTLTEEIDVPAGKVLMRQGETGEEFFLIVSGRVRIERNGRQLDSLGPGDFLGEISLVDGQPRSATATAEEASRLIVIAHREFHSLLDSNPGIQKRVMISLAERVRRLEPEVAH